MSTKGKYGEPLKADGGAIRMASACGSVGHYHCLVASVDFFSGHQEGEQPTRVQRIVDCVNAMDGVANPAAVPAALKALWELLAAADESVRSADDVASMLRYGQADETARAALAALDREP